MDIELPGEDGVIVTRRLTMEMPAVTVVMLTVHDDSQTLFDDTGRRLRSGPIAAGRFRLVQGPSRFETQLTSKTPVEMLAAVDLFTVLTKKEVKKIHDAGKDVQFRAGRTIVSEGETGVGFHLIMQGKAKVTVNGRLRATLGPGDYFGEMAIIDRGPRSATVTAETDVQTLGIASWDFMPVLSQNFEMCRKIMVELSRRLRGAEKSLTH